MDITAPLYSDLLSNLNSKLENYSTFISHFWYWWWIVRINDAMSIPHQKKKKHDLRVPASGKSHFKWTKISAPYSIKRSIIIIFVEIMLFRRIKFDRKVRVMGGEIRNLKQTQQIEIDTRIWFFFRCVKDCRSIMSNLIWYSFNLVLIESKKSWRVFYVCSRFLPFSVFMISSCHAIDSMNMKYQLSEQICKSLFTLSTKLFAKTKLVSR